YSYAKDNPITRKDPNGNISFRDLVEYGHLGKTAYDTGTFALFPNYTQTPEELNEQAFTAISGIVTSGISVLAGGEAKYALSAGMLAADADEWAYQHVCTSVVNCKSYFDTGVRVTLLSPSGPQIKITPLPSSGGNGPVQQQGNGPTQGSVTGPGQGSKSGSISGGSVYAQQVSLYQSLIAILQGYINNSQNNGNSSG